MDEDKLILGVKHRCISWLYIVNILSFSQLRLTQNDKENVRKNTAVHLKHQGAKTNAFLYVGNNSL